MTPTMLGVYGPRAAASVDSPARFSFRRKEWTDVEVWRPVARLRLLERLAPRRKSLSAADSFAFDWFDRWLKD